MTECLMRLYSRFSSRLRMVFSHAPLYLKYWGPATEFRVPSRCFASAVRDYISS